MRRGICGAAVLLVPALWLAAPLSGAQKAPKKPDLKVDDDKTSEKMIKAGLLTGKVLSVSESSKSIKLQVTVVVAVLDQGAVTGMAQAQRDYQMALLRRDRNAAASALQSLARHQASLYKPERKTYDLEVGTTEDVVVRTAKPREEFDDKGKIKKLTKKELDELKGDPKLPGYKAEFSDVQQDQVVRVQLVRKKGAPKPAAKPKKGKTDKEEVDLLGDNLPQASMVVIVYDPPPK